MVGKNTEVADAKFDGGNDVSHFFENSKSILSTQASPFLSSAKGMDYLPSKKSSDVSVPYVEIVDHSSASTWAQGARFDAAKSPSELVAQGAFIDKTPKDADNQSEKTMQSSEKKEDSGAPKISIEMQDLSKDDQDKPHFLIKKDGKVEMWGDPEKSGGKEIAVVVERGEGDLNPTDAQVKATNELTQYLSSRIQTRFPDSKEGVQVDDQDGLISPETKQAAHLIPSEELKGLSQPTQERIQDMNRFNGSSGEMPVSQTDQYFPKREVPRDKNVEGDDLNALKEMIAGLFNPDKQAPYETVRQNTDGGYSVGRYGFNAPLLEGLLEALGDPPDPNMIDALVKAGKLPKAFADKLKNPEFFKKFHDFVDKLKGGHGEVSKQDLAEFLPKDVQESLASILVTQAEAKVGSKPGDIAAAIFSGKSLSQVDAQDLSTARAKQIEDAGNRLYLMADARQHQKAPDEKVHWNKEGLVSIGDGKFLSADAAQALNRARDQMEAAGLGDIIVTSGFRDYDTQKKLYAQLHGIKPVAKPGTSNHEKGNAIDVRNWEKAKPFLLANGFVHGDGRGPLKNDLIHFKYVGGDESTAQV